MRSALVPSLLASVLFMSGIPAAHANPRGDEQDQADDGETPSPRSVPRSRSQNIVRRAELGLHLSLAPGFYVVSDGTAGFSLGAHARYGIDTSLAVFSPGVSLDLGFGGDTFGLGLGTLRATFPIGLFGPFVQGGLGWAQRFSDPSAGSVLFQAGAGFTLYFSAVRLGLEVFYQNAPDLGYHAFLIGPTLAF